MENISPMRSPLRSRTNTPTGKTDPVLQLTSLQAQFRKETSEIKERNERLEAQILRVTERYQDSQTELRRCKNDIDVRDKDLKKSSKIIEAYKQKQPQLEITINKQKTMITKLEHSITIGSKADKLVETNSRISEENSELKVKNAELLLQTTTMEKELGCLKAQMAKYEQNMAVDQMQPKAVPIIPPISANQTLQVEALKESEAKLIKENKALIEEYEILTLNIEELKYIRESNNEELVILESRIQDLEVENEQLTFEQNGASAQAGQEIQNLKQQLALYSNLENERDNLRSQIEDKDAKIAELQNQIKQRPCMSPSNTWEAERGSLKSKLAEKEVQLNSAQEREAQLIAQSKIANENWSNEREAMQSKISKLAVQADKLVVLENQMDEEREQWDKDRQKLQLRMAKLSAEREELQKDREVSQRQYSEFEAERDEWEQDVAAWKRKYSKIAAEREEMEREIESMKSRPSNYKSQINETKPREDKLDKNELQSAINLALNLAQPPPKPVPSRKNSEDLDDLTALIASQQRKNKEILRTYK